MKHNKRFFNKLIENKVNDKRHSSEGKFSVGKSLWLEPSERYTPRKGKIFRVNFPEVGSLLARKNDKKLNKLHTYEQTYPHYVQNPTNHFKKNYTQMKNIHYTENRCL